LLFSIWESAKVEMRLFPRHGVATGLLLKVAKANRYGLF